MKLEDAEFEQAIYANVKIFMYLASKYLRSLPGYERSDLIQEQIIACYKASAKYDGVGKLSAFLYAVAENQLNTIYKLNTRQKRMPKQISYLDGTKLGETKMFLADGTNDVEQDFYITEIWSNADLVAKQCLSQFEYYVFIECICKGRSKAKVGAETFKTTKQIANAISRIRTKMREKRGLIVNDI